MRVAAAGVASIGAMEDGFWEDLGSFEAEGGEFAGYQCAYQAWPGQYGLDRFLANPAIWKKTSLIATQGSQAFPWGCEIVRSLSNYALKRNVRSRLL